MNGKSRPRLTGWDDEKVYFSDAGAQHCVTDEPELLERLERMCGEYCRGKQDSDGSAYA